MPVRNSLERMIYTELFFHWMIFSFDSLFMFKHFEQLFLIYELHANILNSVLSLWFSLIKWLFKNLAVTSCESKCRKLQSSLKYIEKMLNFILLDFLEAKLQLCKASYVSPHNVVPQRWHHHCVSIMGWSFCDANFLTKLFWSWLI